MYKISDNINTEYLSESDVLVDFNTGKFFGVNEVSAEIIMGIKTGQSTDEIVNIIVEKYDVSIEKAQADVANFIDSLLEQGFIEKIESK